MSTWTHICGCIRFEYFDENCSPIDENYNPAKMINIIEKVFCRSIWKPEGSEGTFGTQVIYGSRGPILVCEGDLRDYGKDYFHRFIEWLNGSFEEIHGVRPNGYYEFPLSIRDCCIYLESSSCENEINLIMYNDNIKEFELITKGIEK